MQYGNVITINKVSKAKLITFTTVWSKPIILCVLPSLVWPITRAVTASLAQEFQWTEEI